MKRNQRRYPTIPRQMSCGFLIPCPPISSRYAPWYVTDGTTCQPTWPGYYWLSYRRGTGHGCVRGNSAVVLLCSNDLRRWRQAHIFEPPVKVSSTAEGSRPDTSPRPTTRSTYSAWSSGLEKAVCPRASSCIGRATASTGSRPRSSVWATPILHMAGVPPP